MNEREWILTDPDCFQLVRNPQNEEYEMWKVIPFGDEWAAVNAYVDLDGYMFDDTFVKRYLKPCGFESLDDVYWCEDTYRLIAETIFEVDLPLFEKSMIGTFDECVDFIIYVTGFDDETVRDRPVKRLVDHMVDDLRDVQKTDADYDRARFALKHDLSRFDFDDWCSVCKVLQKDIPYDEVHYMNEFFEEWNELPERKGKPYRDWNWTNYGEDQADELRSIWAYCKDRAETELGLRQEVGKIVQKCGGFREQKVWAEKNTILRDETWNKDHKVVNVLSLTPEADGYRSGFQVDLVAKSICG